MENDIMNTFPKRQEGQGLVEYALILVLVAVVVIVILQLLGPSIVLTYARVMGGFEGQTISGSGPEGLVISYTANNAGSDGEGCYADISNIVLVATNNGSIITNEDVTFRISAVRGTSGAVMTATASGSGLITVAGPLTRSGPCPLRLEVERQ
jgi:pilus assembly protein Flp/PilA